MTCFLVKFGHEWKKVCEPYEGVTGASATPTGPVVAPVAAAPADAAVLPPVAAGPIVAPQVVAEALLARYKLPHDIVFADTLPRNAAGKIHKPALRQNFDGPALA